MEEVEGRVESFKNLPEPVRRNMGDILLAATSGLYSLYQDLKKAAPFDPSVEYVRSSPFPLRSHSSYMRQEKQELREKVRALVHYAGRIPYRNPDLNNLIRYEVLMRP
jgi:hypothetical protein